LPAQKPTDTVRTVIRLRRQVRQRVEREAQKNQCSANMEMARRIEQSFEVGAVRSIEDIATELSGSWASWKAQEREIRRMCETWTGKRGKVASGA
jgi:hypothetical protein